MAKKKKPEFEYSKEFDRLMEQRFNEVFKTEWNIFAGSFGGFTTARENGKKLTREMVHYGRGVSDGIAAMQAWNDMQAWNEL